MGYIFHESELPNLVSVVPGRDRFLIIPSLEIHQSSSL
jgi:hypothetical protein